MESTGVFWVPLFQILEQRGLEVCPINARHVKNVSGRKTDVSDLPVAAKRAFGGIVAGFISASAAVLRTAFPAGHRDSLVQKSLWAIDLEYPG